MKSFFKKIVIAFLEWEAKAVLKKHRPKIVAITGSVGKTSTKDAVYSVFSHFFPTRKSEKSFNSEIGVPLTILGLSNGWSNLFLWLLIIFRGFFVKFSKTYPKWLVLEVGADRPGDIKKIATWLKPDIVVITRFAKVPVHVEFFATPRHVIEEKIELVKALKPEGVLILNADDNDVLTLKSSSRHRTITFGFGVEADVRGSNEQIFYKGADGKKLPAGMSMKVNYSGNSLPLLVWGTIGRPALYACLSAVSAGIAEELNLIEIVESLSDKDIGPNGRLKIILGNKGTVIIDDSYNSSPVALEESLNLLESIENSGRKIAVLGGMMELGKYSEKEHEQAGIRVAGFVDALLTVGEKGEHIAKAARRSGLGEENIFSFGSSLEAGRYLDDFIKTGDIILVKGSQSTRMERVVAEIMANPEKKSESLVRQDKEWLEKV